MQMIRVTCTIRQDQKEWLSNNPQISVSGVLQKAIDYIIEGGIFEGLKLKKVIEELQNRIDRQQFSLRPVITLNSYYWDNKENLFLLEQNIGHIVEMMKRIYKAIPKKNMDTEIPHAGGLEALPRHGRTLGHIQFINEKDEYYYSKIILGGNMV